MAQLNFAFLKSSSLFSNQYKTANKILKLYEIEDYRDVMINSRLLLESIVKKIFIIEKILSILFQLDVIISEIKCLTY